MEAKANKWIEQAAAQDDSLKTTKERLKIMGEMIFEARTKRGLSPSQLGQAIGATGKEILQIENGKKNLTANRLLLIMMTLDLSLTVKDKHNGEVLREINGYSVVYNSKPLDRYLEWEEAGCIPQAKKK